MVAGCISLLIPVEPIISGGNDFPMASRNRSLPAPPKRKAWPWHQTVAPSSLRWRSRTPRYGFTTRMASVRFHCEGNGSNPKFTPDGKKLCYLIVKEAPNEFAWYRNPGELRIADLESGRSEPVVRGLQVLDYDISADGQKVVIWTADREGKPRLWVAPFDRSAPLCRFQMWKADIPDLGPAAMSSFAIWKECPRLFTEFTRTAPG